MADNVPFTITGATYTAATDKVTYSGDANVDVQLTKIVGVTGAEGSKTVTEVTGTAGSPGTAVLTVQGVASGTVIPVADGSGSLTVDAPVATPVFVRLSDGAAAITTLPVSIASAPSTPVTNIGTFAVQDSEKVADNTGFTDGTTKVQPVGFIYDDVAGTALSENDAAAARIDSKRAIVNVLEDATTRGQRAAISAAGALKVDGSAVTQPVSVASLPSQAVTNVGVFATQIDGAALTSLQLIDDPIATLGTTTYSEATTKGMIVGAVRRDANTTMVDTTNEVAPLQVDASGSLKVAIISGAGSGGTAIADDAAFTVATTSLTPVGGTYKSTVDAVDDGDAGAFHMTARRALHSSIRKESDGSEMAVAATAPLFVRLSDGAAAIATLPVELASVPSHAVTNAGTFVVQENGAALTALQLIDNLPNTIGSTTSGQSGAMAMGAVTTAAPTYTTAQTHPVSLDTAGSLRVAVMSGGLTAARAATSTLANVSGSATSVTLQASNSSRLRLDIYNDSESAAYVKYGSTASTTSFTKKLEPYESMSEDLYTGIVTAIWDTATGAARMTELTT